MLSIPHVGSERLKENHVVSSDRGKRQRLRFKEGAALAADGISLARLLGGHLEERRGKRVCKEKATSEAKLHSFLLCDAELKCSYYGDETFPT